MVSVFAAAFVLGLLFNAAPGAVFAETVRRGVRGGFRPAFDVQVGSLVGDASWAMLGLAGVGLLLRVEALRVPVAVAGIAYLLWLSVDAWRASGHGHGPGADPTGAARGALRSGVMLSLTNPHNVAFWAAVGSALGGLGVAEPGFADYAVFFGGFMTSSLAWAVLCAAAVHALFRRADERWARLTHRLCAIAFAVLAAASLRELLA